MGQPTVIADSFILAAEIASNPPVPDVNSIQLYAKDVAGITHWFSQDHAGNVVDITAATTSMVAFSAHKNGVDQTGVPDITFTAVTFGTEIYDLGGFFSASAWTPPSGLVSLTATVIVTGTITAGSQISLSIFKNGVNFRQTAAAQLLNAGGTTVVMEDLANGTDVYSVQVFVDVTAGTATVLGGPNATYFMGHVIR